ncbi:MAG: dephospho-CoA kinase [Bacteroidota bacterium]
MNEPKKIGVTGGIGSGKSLVCSIFSHLGVPVYDSDSRAKWLMNSDTVIHKELIERFGQESFTADGKLNRSYIAGKVFNNENNLQDLNQIVHPRVAIDFDKWCQEHQKVSFIIKEAALMFESGVYRALDKVINVSAPTNIRIERVLKRDTFRSKEEVLSIIDKQMSEEERLERSDEVVYNDDKTMVIPQILKLYHSLSN